MFERCVLTPQRRRRRTKVVLFADTFNRYFERENLDAALAVLIAGGYRVHFAKPADGRRARCAADERSFRSAKSARRAEARRSLDALAPFVARGVPVVGLEPSCLLSFRDEVPAMMEAKREAASDKALTFEEFLAREAEAGRLSCR